LIDLTYMKAIFLLATLKKSPEISNTEALCHLLMQELQKNKVEGEIVKLVEHNIPPGLKTNMGPGDDWPQILDKVLASDILIFATPIWWGIQSSLMQRIIERMDELNDELLETGKSEFANKIGGVVITGAEDGAQHIIGNLCNFMSWNGLTIPPACSLSFLGWPTADTLDGRLSEMLKKDKKLADNAKVMAGNLSFLANLLKQNPLPHA
jgi:multimeric flavodoxin WrbA